MSRATNHSYLQASLAYAECEFLPNNATWYCEIPLLSGVWAEADSKDACLKELAEVVEDWLDLGARLGHHAPVIDGLLPERIVAG